MLARFFAAALGALGVITLVAFATTVRAATPTPSTPLTVTPASATPAATATPLPPNTFRLRVVNDLNGDDQAQEDEPGLPNWRVTEGCTDALLMLTTDADGYVYVSQLSDTGSETLGCFRVDRPFGWFTRELTVRPAASIDRSKPWIVLMRNLGSTVMELHGEAIGRGVPLVQGVPGVAAPFESCGQLIVEGISNTIARVRVIVSGGDTRAGCPEPGAGITPAISGEPGGSSVPFSRGANVAVSFVLNGDSMRFYSNTYPITAAWVLDVASGTIARDCLEARDLRGFVPQGSQRLYVLSDEARQGCGAPGRTVLFFSGERRLAPGVEWRAGDVDRIDLTPERATDVIISPPDTGSAGLVAR